MSSRADYQKRRFALLRDTIDIPNCVGLEIGACDLPTVPREAGQCRYADFRSADEMITAWDLPPETVCHVDYLLSRHRPPNEQIADRFDYVVACHVLEHIADPISYLQSLQRLLKDGPGKVIFITLPDKRATPDATRPSTTVEHLLACHHERSTKPSFEAILEFHRHWVGYANGGTKPLALAQAYAHAAEYFKTDDADAHCNVWRDFEFRDQVEELAEAGFLPGLRISLFEPFFVGTNEFAIALKTIA
ncbi:methyltransferase domain-containing protein [Sphingomonas kaistensis]|uniref:Methyltransferase domain-containing protein n=1 Tax=Sphingomonas kaistensis TaxID=298708 RepID=A0ABZ2G363_9SPHN